MSHQPTTGKIYLEEYEFAIKQLEAAAIMVKVCRAAPKDAITEEERSTLCDHLSTLLDTSIAALDCFTPN